MAREGGNELVLIAEQVPWRLRPHTMNPFATYIKAKGAWAAPAVPWAAPAAHKEPLRGRHQGEGHLDGPGRTLGGSGRTQRTPSRPT